LAFKYYISLLNSCTFFPTFLENSENLKYHSLLDLFVEVSGPKERLIAEKGSFKLFMSGP
jgi:hypothetical protein